MLRDRTSFVSALYKYTRATQSARFAYCGIVLSKAERNVSERCEDRCEPCADEVLKTNRTASSAC
jgi:hypothetical protein